jgi:hypothetical protein
MASRHQLRRRQAVGQRTARAVLMVASVEFVLVLTLVICVLVASMFFPDGTRWLLSGGHLLD